jgi:hypothetical protein
LLEHEEIEEAEAADRADRAALDTSPELERHRRYQSAMTREFLRTLDALRKMRKAERGVGKEGWGMADDRWQVADGRF